MLESRAEIALQYGPLHEDGVHPPPPTPTHKKNAVPLRVNSISLCRK